MMRLHRTLLAIAVLTALAGSAMHMQASAMTRVVAERQLRRARATAMDIAAGELARADSMVRSGRTAAGARHVNTQQGRLRVETWTERQAAHRHRVRVSVADDSGRVLSEYETVVEVKRR